MQGESALVRDAGDELIKIMLFYIGVGEKRTKRMDDIVDAFGLKSYFPSIEAESETLDFDALAQRIETWNGEESFQLNTIRKLISNYFESEESDSEQLNDLIKQFELLDNSLNNKEINVVDKIVSESLSTVRKIQTSEIERSDDASFHIASAFMFVENAINIPTSLDENWKKNGELKYQALVALNEKQEMTADMDGSQLSCLLYTSPSPRD